MSMPSTYLNVRNNNAPDFQILAPVPIRMGQPFPSYNGMVSRIDSTIAPGTWNCSCANSFGPGIIGVKDSANAIVDPGTIQGGAFYSEVNCANVPRGCTDPASLTYDVNAQVGQQLSCVYAGPTSSTSCTTARVPAGGCRHVPFRHSHE